MNASVLMVVGTHASQMRREGEIGEKIEVGMVIVA